MQRPRGGGVLGLFDEDEPSERTAPPTVPQCIYCAKATLRCDLVRAGLVVDTGRTRETRWGRDAVVWAAR